MSTEPGRVAADWLALREPADGAARSSELVEVVLSSLPSSSGRTVVHDLGCGTGSMARWLAGQLPGAQHWVMYDLDVTLLDLAAAQPPGPALDRAPVTSEVRSRDITRLDGVEGADLITASALLDMLTAEEVHRLVGTCVAGRCPVLITLSVVGRVDLMPADPFDQRVAEAFNAHQRRLSGARRLLGPDAVSVAARRFSEQGLDVLIRESPWRLGPEQAALASEWFVGWLAAAREQQPQLGREASRYAQRRMAEAAAGELMVTVHHADLLARPRLLTPGISVESTPRRRSVGPDEGRRQASTSPAPQLSGESNDGGSPDVAGPPS